MIRNRLATEQLTPDQPLEKKEIIPAARVLMSSQARRSRNTRPLTSNDTHNRNKINYRFATFYHQSK